MPETTSDHPLCGPEDPQERRRAFVDLFVRVEGDVRRIARGLLWNPNGTLTPTGLVNLAFERLVASASISRGDAKQFLALAANALKQTLIDEARRKMAEKRGGQIVFATLGDVAGDTGISAEELVAVHVALDRLTVANPSLATIVEYKFYLGLTNGEVADMLGIHTNTVERQWEKARAWLYRALSPKC
jgi:RNA polymerase sigma factor (TIGR02999 family)